MTSRFGHGMLQFMSHPAAWKTRSRDAGDPLKPGSVATANPVEPGQTDQWDDGPRRTIGEERTDRDGSIGLKGDGKFELATKTVLRLKSGQMLYERWQKVVRDRRNEVALRDLASGRSWTFAQLDREAETALPDNPAMVFPQGHSPEFIFTVLRAWRRGAVVCPLEAHHQPLAVSASALAVLSSQDHARHHRVSRAPSPSRKNNWRPMPKIS